MKFIAKVVRIGNSLGITLPTSIRKQHAIDKGTMLEVSVKRFEKKGADDKKPVESLEKN